MRKFRFQRGGTAESYGEARGNSLLREIYKWQLEEKAIEIMKEESPERFKEIEKLDEREEKLIKKIKDLERKGGFFKKRKAKIEKFDLTWIRKEKERILLEYARKNNIKLKEKK